MFGLGFGEVLVILLVALVFLGPKRLPEVGKKLGELYRQLRDVTETMKGTISHEMEPDSDTSSPPVTKKAKPKPAPRQDTETSKDQTPSHD